MGTRSIRLQPKSVGDRDCWSRSLPSLHGWEFPRRTPPPAIHRGVRTCNAVRASGQQLMKTASGDGIGFVNHDDPSVWGEDGSDPPAVCRAGRFTARDRITSTWRPMCRPVEPVVAERAGVERRQTARLVPRPFSLSEPGRSSERISSKSSWQTSRVRWLCRKIKAGRGRN